LKLSLDGYGYNRNSSRIPKDDQGHETDEKKLFNDRRSSTPPVASATNLPPLPSELNDYIGRILVLSNVAYRATREEILDFLRPYSPIPIHLKYVVMLMVNQLVLVLLPVKQKLMHPELLLNLIIKHLCHVKSSFNKDKFNSSYVLLLNFLFLFVLFFFVICFTTTTYMYRTVK